MTAAEVNFDGLVGPTHNYAGLSLGNRASMGSAGAVSSPRRAAMQGLAKMRLLHSLGLIQGVFPPHWRPDGAALRALGFESGATLAEALKIDRALVGGLTPTLMSASAMWAANSATVSPSADTTDGRVHFTPANLSSTTHRSFEPAQTTATLRTIFADDAHFKVHDPLPATAAFADEGAANHGRLTVAHGEPGVHLFVYGRQGDEPATNGGYPRRQTRLAGELISAGHGLDPGRVVFARQSEQAIDAGAFHNDVVSVVNENVVFAHELAFADGAAVMSDLERAAGVIDGSHTGIRFVQVRDGEVPLADAVSSYLFNSQLISPPSRSGAHGSMTLIAPREVDETPSTTRYLRRAVEDPTNPIGSVHTLDLRESMRNGGGPACLRLRVVLTTGELEALRGRVIVDDPLLDQLEAWVTRHYRDELAPSDLIDPALEIESATALDELTRILGLGSLYEFQR